MSIEKMDLLSAWRDGTDDQRKGTVTDLLAPDLVELLTSEELDEVIAAVRADVGKVLCGATQSTDSTLKLEAADYLKKRVEGIIIMPATKIPMAKLYTEYLTFLANNGVEGKVAAMDFQRAVAVRSTVGIKSDDVWYQKMALRLGWRESRGVFIPGDTVSNAYRYIRVAGLKKGLDVSNGAKPGARFVIAAFTKNCLVKPVFASSSAAHSPFHLKPVVMS